MMKRLLFLLLLATPAFAQGISYENFVMAANGPGGSLVPVTSANITVCAGVHAEVPCTPTASIFSDVALTLSVAQPISTSPLGNYKFFAAAGTYSISITGTGISAANDVIVLPGSGSGGGTVTVTGSPVAGNLVKFSGGTSITNGDLSGDVSTAGTLVATLANTTVTPGSCGDATHSCALAVDGKGRITSQTNTALTATVSSVATTSPITGGTITGTGTIACATCVTSASAMTSGQIAAGAGSQGIQVSNLSGDITTAGTMATTLATVNSNVGSFTNANITVNAKGLVTAAANGSGSGLSGMTATQIPVAASANTITSSIPLQGTDSAVLSSGTISGTGVSLCTDANGGATTSGCSGGSSAWSAITAGSNSATGAFSTAGPWTFSVAGAASTPGVAITGTPFQGTATTSTPQLYVNTSVTQPSSWNTNGTSFGINCPGGNAIDMHSSGGSSNFSVTCAGQITTVGALVATGQVRTGTNYAFSANHLISSATAPTIGTCGTSPSIASSNGTATFVVNVGTGGTATTCTVTMPAATAGWSCTAAPTGAPQAAAINYVASTSTTQITISNYTLSTGAALAWSSGQTLNVNCVGY